MMITNSGDMGCIHCGHSNKRLRIDMIIVNLIILVISNEDDHYEF